MKEEEKKDKFTFEEVANKLGYSNFETNNPCNGVTNDWYILLIIMMLLSTPNKNEELTNIKEELKEIKLILASK